MNRPTAFFSLLLALGVVMPLPALADCKAIVEQTVAELRIAYPEWTDPMETLARTAAASACVKASGVSSSGTALTSTSIAAASSPAADKDDEAEDSAKSDGEDEGWNPFKDIKFNKVSARPNKKPYERKRDVTNTND